MAIENKIRRVIRWGLYPVSWIWVVCALNRFLAMGVDERPAWILITLPLLLTYLVIELTLPMQKRWSMTWRTLLPDLAYIVSSGATVALVSAGLAMLTITISSKTGGPARDWPIWIQLPVLFLVFEFMNYHIHRGMHELRGPLGRLLWRIHAAHHLPERLYLLMHAVSHPFNAVLVQAFAIILPIWLMGYSPDTVLIFLVIDAFHGIISHFNVDLRLGWANYIFVGPEVHRYHHSADVNEAKNYGATLTLWDQIFGTFVFHPGLAPQELGVSPDANLPPYQQIPSVLALPFRRSGQESLEQADHV
ncbi:sterol desaturase family protein [Rhizobium leguminosarum]|uniref:sterol desaturase family protein n=1 Tax=Rhizobium leguminosarum TaxID=384 RepID=UPI00102FCA1C|nr:sterol desaturase family protein [Rhizobium leguminosarum]TAX54641.1 sterol desaturase family protein [Rhizobium leguminosarum]TAY00506.1 sterol desaturase family protein [Rhizobium leguminosarum]